MFAGLTIGWTWPLVLHLRDAIPGGPGDNYSFLWYLWWMRHVLATPGLSFFHTTFLFYPFGASIANNPHTALPALIAATLLRPASVVTAQNLLLLAYVFANMATMYALAWDVTKDKSPSTLAAIIFGLSPYVAAHFPGHFELMAVWTLPAFVIFFRRACQSGSRSAAILAGVIAAATAYTSYYYFVYQAMLAAVFLLAWIDPVALTASRRPNGVILTVIRGALLSTIAALALLALWIATTGGRAMTIGAIALSATTPQGPLAVMWILVLVWAACTWRVRVAPRAPTTSVSNGTKPVPLNSGTKPVPLNSDPNGTRSVPSAKELPRRQLASTMIIVAVVTLAGTAPLLWQAIRLVRSGEYVTPTYFWRSAPRGVDLLAPLLGHPAHALYGAFSTQAYAALHLDPVETIGWLGIVPVLMLFVARPGLENRRERRAWRASALAFAVWAAGPFLTIGGFDTGLKLPEVLARWVPFVANARMPGRAMVVVFMAIAMLIAIGMHDARTLLTRRHLFAVALSVLIFEYWDAPIALTHLDVPTVYTQLASAPPGAVCEVPFGIGDGLSPGVGSQDRRALYYATIHEHPLVGGYLGRMPTDAERLYEAMPVVGTLLRLSDGRSTSRPLNSEDVNGSVCRYLVVDHATSSPELIAYVRSLPLELVTADGPRELYRTVR